LTGKTPDKPTDHDLEELDEDDEAEAEL